MEKKRQYIAIDLKSFYASAECVDRDKDPLTTNLVVADPARTEKTICLAVSPSLKAYGIPGRARLFEVVQAVEEANRKRLEKLSGKHFLLESTSSEELRLHPEYKIGYITAPPRMAFYMEKSTQIYHIYLNYIAPEDIHVYSIDEVFLDVTHYLTTYGMTARELAAKMMQDIFDQTGITATAGIGTNLYLCKVAMDIVAKHVKTEKSGMRISELDELSYRKMLWNHTPLTDFWRVGAGYCKKLEQVGIYTMGDIARCSMGGPMDYYNEELLYQFFGVNAELLIDHAWGYEPVEIADIKAYEPENNSICSGQVLQCPYTAEDAGVVVREMAEFLALDLVEKRYVTDQIILTIGYDIDNLTDPGRAKSYRGEVTIDRYGRRVPKHAHGTANLDDYTSSTAHIIEKVMQLYENIIRKELLIRRIAITANHVVKEEHAPKKNRYEQLTLFAEEKLDTKSLEQKEKEKRERKLQEAMLSVKKKFGKNAMLKGTNLKKGATAMERNSQIGGHKA